MSEPFPSDLAEALQLTAARRGHVGEPAFYFTETGSTNDVAARLAEGGAPEGTAVVASSQTSGRGRFGRTWFSPPGAGLYVSVVFRDPRTVPLLTLAGGVAVAEGIRAATGLPVMLKWPNDVVVHSADANGRRRKLAGVLAEASTTPEGLQHVILGFGINLRPAAYPPAIADRATSIETELGRAPDTGAVLGETLAALSQGAATLAAGQAGEVLGRWRELAPSARGSSVKWDVAGVARSGVTEGIDETGALLVRVGNAVERIISGELEWR